MIDFKRTAADLLARADSLLPQWFPEGRRVGHEFKVGNLQGDKGDSLSINLNTGVWRDFAADVGGADLISLYAAANGLRQGDAAAQLGAGGFSSSNPPPPSPRRTGDNDTPHPAPNDAALPGPHPRYGEPTATYAYRNEEGRVLFLVCRYDTAAGKQFTPYVWSGAGWRARAFPRPRPLYNLPQLAARPQDPVLVVEGEKAADAAAGVLPGVVVTTWAGGASSWRTADWAPLGGRTVTVWPDADLPGMTAGAGLAAALAAAGARVAVVDVSEGGHPAGWDVADAVAAGWGESEATEFVAMWARPYKPATGRSEPPAGGDTAPEPIAVPRRTAGRHASRMGQMDAANAAGMMLKNNGFPYANELNCVAALNHAQIDVHYDTFLQRTMYAGRPMEDGDFCNLAVFMQATYALDVRVNLVRSAIEGYVMAHRRNIAQEWLRGLKWDGEPRLHLLLPEVFGTPADDYHAAVGRCFVIGIVARILNPGCKLDTMPIFEGEQGVRKSTALAVLGGPWFADCNQSILDKDFLQIMPGKILIEIAELHAFKRADIERIKGIISTATDTYRKSYGRVAGDYPRSCAFAGTTNSEQYLTDPTGARRFWPVACGTIDVERLREWREQLFAEAASLHDAGAKWWDVPHETAAAAQEERYEGDPWEDAVRSYGERIGTVRIGDVLGGVLEIPRERQDRLAASRVRAILKRLGYESIVVRAGGTVERVWENRKLTHRPSRQFDEF